MIKVTLIGKGNVSQHLMRAFSEAKDVTVLQVISSRKKALSSSLKNEQIKKKIDDSDICIIAVTDDAIIAVSQQLKNINSLIVHTSGSVPLNALSKNIKRGVFYPLQTFSKEREIEFENVPICVEAKNAADLSLLKKLAYAVSNSVYEVDSIKRKQLHLAAVFVNNFTNQLYHIGHKICEENELPFDLLRPLIKETAKKVEELLPIQSQTGPAKRNDKSIIQEHLNQLKSQNHKKIYHLMTESIQHTHGKEL